MPGRKSDIREVHQDEETEAAIEDREEYEVLADIFGSGEISDDPAAKTTQEMRDLVEKELGVSLGESGIRRRCHKAVREGKMKEVLVRRRGYSRPLQAWIILGAEQSQ